MVFSEKKGQVLLIGSNESYLLRSVIQQIHESDIDTVFSRGVVNEVSKLGTDFSVIVLYLDENIVINLELLVYVKDLAAENDIPIFLMGYDSDIEDVKKVISPYLIRSEFVRPLNAKNVSTEIIKFLDNHSVTAKKKILVVDDSGASLRVIKSWLGDKYQVILAYSGMMAIKYLTQDTPDLVLLDYEMPIVDGPQVLEMIRSEPEFADLPVIFLTSKGDRESIMKVVKLKPNGYLLKSMNSESIINAIGEFFEKQKAEL